MNIRTDVMGAKIHNNQRIVSENIQKAMNRLSTGLRINSASDDSAGLSIETRMNAQVRELLQSNRNINDGKSLIKTIDGNLSTIQDMLVRARELSIQAQNGTHSPTDIQSIESEYKQILEALDNISSKSTFNGIKLLQGGTGLNFNKLNQDYLNIGPQPELRPTEYSFDVWFNTTSDTKDIIYRSRTYGHAISINNGKVISSYNSSDAASHGIVSSNIYNDGLWHHVFSSFDGNEIKLYIDDKLVGSKITTKPIYYNTTGIAIGRDGDFSTGYFDGLIGDVRLWDQAIDPNNIEDVNGLIGHWKMNDINSGNVIDQSVNSNNATIMGNPELINEGDNFVNLHTFGSQGNFKLNKAYIDSEELKLQDTQINDPNTLNAIDRAVDTISSLRSYYGSSANRLDMKLENNNTSIFNTTETISRISSADFAQESSSLIKEQIKIQSSIQMLQKNNTNRESIISLMVG